MDSSNLSPEQQQLIVEMKSVLTNIKKEDNSDKSYEIEQGRKLIEKAVKIGVSEQSYAELQKHVASHNTKTS